MLDHELIGLISAALLVAGGYFAGFSEGLKKERKSDVGFFVKAGMACLALGAGMFIFALL